MSPRKKKSDPEPTPAEKTAAASTAPEEPAATVPSIPEPEAAPAPGSDETGTGQSFDDEEDEGVDSVATRRVVIFFLEGQRYAFAIERVQEIQQIVALKQVPETSAAVVGMIDLRGEVIPVVDMRTIVGLPFRTYGVQTPMIICSAGGLIVAAVVDEVQDVVEVPEECMQPPSRLHALADRLEAVCRMDDDLVLLLDLERVLSPESLGLVTGEEVAG